MTNSDKIRVSAAKSQLKVSVSKALASALITGIDNCEQEGHPLNQVQQIYLATMSIMTYSEAIEGCELIDTELSLQYIVDM